MPQATVNEAIRRAEATPGYMSPAELKWLVDLARQLSPGDIWVELGCFVGRSLLAVGLSLPDECGLISVDCNWGSIVRQGLTAHELFREIGQSRQGQLSLHAVRDRSEQAYRFYPDQSIDVVFVDADHSYEATRESIEVWLPKIRPGGVICGHDYNLESWPGVVRAVDDFGFEHVIGAGSIWAGRVDT